jgi:hypothetical protein
MRCWDAVTQRAGSSKMPRRALAQNTRARLASVTAATVFCSYNRPMARMTVLYVRMHVLQRFGHPRRSSLAQLGLARHS